MSLLLIKLTHELNQVCEKNPDFHFNRMKLTEKIPELTETEHTH